MAVVKRLISFLAIVLLAVVMFGAGWLTARLGIGLAIDPASLTVLERQFTEQMNGAALVGRFTVVGREDRPAGQDRYDIVGVQKVGDERWQFQTRIRYGGKDITLPVVVPMRWVGDTPIIAMTDYRIPTLGTFTVRVVFYRDRYFGSWQHDEVGGHMFGRIAKGAAESQ